MSSNPAQGEVYSIQNSLCDKVYLRRVGGFSLSTPISSTSKTDRHDITEMLLKVALNTINLTPPYENDTFVK